MRRTLTPARARTFAYVLVAVFIGLNMIVRFDVRRKEAKLMPSPAVEDLVYLGAITDSEMRELGRLSSFDVPIGGYLGGVVPVVEVSDSEKAKMRTAWRTLFHPKCQPLDPGQAIWRKVLWSRLVRSDAKRGLDFRPWVSSADDPQLRWYAPQCKCEAEQRLYGSATIRVTARWVLSRDDRVHFRSPRRDEMKPQVLWIVVTDVDKRRLLDLVSQTLRVPWNTVDDFVVKWSPSAKPGPGHLRIEPATPKAPGPREWYDEVGLRIEGQDEQEVRISATYFLPGAEE